MAGRIIRNVKKEEAPQEITPMIDVVFQILIFFLVTAQIKSVEEHIKIYLPTDEGLQTTPQEKLDKPEPVFLLIADDLSSRNNQHPQIRYQRNCTYFINSKDGVGYRDPNQLREALKPLWTDPETELIIYPADERNNKDQQTPWKNVMAAVDAGIAANFKKIKFRPPKVFW